MSFEIELTLDEKSWNDFFEIAKKLPAEVGQKALKGAMKEGAEIIKDGVLKQTPVRTGRLANAIRVRSKSKYEPMFFKYQVYVKSGKKRGDSEGAFYAHFVEYGHAVFYYGTKVGTYEPAQPFMRTGFDQSVNPAFRLVEKKALDFISNRWNKLIA